MPDDLRAQLRPALVLALALVLVLGGVLQYHMGAGPQEPLHAQPGHGAFGHQRVLPQGVLHLHGRDPVRAHLQHVVAAALVGEHAVLAHVDIARGQPAAGQHGLGGLLRALPIGPGQPRPPEEQVAGRAVGHLRALAVAAIRAVTGDKAHLEAGQGLAAGAAAHAAWAVGQEQVEGLGGADAVQDLHAGLALPLLAQAGGQGLARGVAQAQGRQVKARRAGLKGPQQEIVQGGHAEEQARPVPGDGLEELIRAGLAGEEHPGGSEKERQGQAGHEPVGKGHLAGREEHVACRDAQDRRAPGGGRAEQVGLGVGHALGAARGAGAVEHEARRVPGDNNGFELCGLGPQAPGAVQAAGEHHPCFRHAARGLGSGRVLPGDERRGRAVGQDKGVVPGREHGAHGHGHGAQEHGPEKGLEVGEAVGQHQHHALAGAHAARAQQVGEAGRVRSQGAVGERVVAAEEGGLVRAALQVPGQQACGDVFGLGHGRCLLWRW